MFDVAAVRKQFPILARRVARDGGTTATPGRAAGIFHRSARGHPLTYLDHGASTHAPRDVLEAVQEFCSTRYANIHRGNHTLSQEASEDFEAAGETLGRFVGADPATQPVILGQNTTHVLDIAAHLVAARRGKTLTTMAEHHSNDLPHRRRGKTVRADVDEEGRILLEDVERKLRKNRIKLLAVTGASNVTGLMPPIHKLARLAHDHDALILVDAAQLYAHAPIEVKPAEHAEHIDMIAAAGHKAYAPFGSAFLAAPKELIDEAPPYVPGGGTVRWVTEDDVLFTKGPDRHMGGTPNIVGAIAFAAATRWLSGIGMENVRSHEEELVELGLKRFKELADDHGVRLLGPTDATCVKEKVGVFAFVTPSLQHDKLSIELDRRYGIATRNGCFCAQPLLNRLLKLGAKPEWTRAVSRGEDVEIPGATRATFGIYNREEDVEMLARAIGEVVSGKAGDSLVKLAKSGKAMAANPGGKKHAATAREVS